MQCNKCGSNIPDEQDFCNKCGAKRILTQIKVDERLENVYCHNDGKLLESSNIDASCENKPDKSYNKKSNKKKLVLTVFVVLLLCIGGYFCINKLMKDNSDSFEADREEKEILTSSKSELIDIFK